MCLKSEYLLSSIGSSFIPKATNWLCWSHGLYLHTIIKFLFISALFSIATFATGHDEFYHVRSQMDPVVLKIEPIESSQIGGYFQGADQASTVRVRFQK